VARSSSASAWAVYARAYRFVSWAKPSRCPSKPRERAAASVSHRVSLTPQTHLSGIFFLPKPATDFFPSLPPTESVSQIPPFLSWNRLRAIKPSPRILPLHLISARSTETISRELRSDHRRDRPPTRAPRRFRDSSALVFYLGEFALIYTSSRCTCFAR
jgi:hypothetical protein